MVRFLQGLADIYFQVVLSFCSFKIQGYFLQHASSSTKTGMLYVTEGLCGSLMQ